MKLRNRTSLKSKMLGNLVIFALVLIIATGALVGAQYYFSQMRTYSKQAFDYARTAATLIDGDRIPGYVETGEKDDYYYEVLDYLNAAQLETGLKYYYVFVPYEDDLVYVWDAVNVEGACDLGVHEKYMSEESKATTFSVFQKDPPEEISVQRDATYGHIASAYSPVFNSAGDPVAVVGVDLSIPGIRRSVLQYMLIVFFSITGLTLAAMVIFYASTDKNVIRPITTLTRSTSEMRTNLENDEVFEMDIHTGDELEELADSVIKMDRDLREYIRELSEVTAEKERIGAELNIAQRIQAGMLPRIFPPFPDRNEFELFASMRPAKEVGGDFYDFFMVDDHHIALVMADVSGKGVPAALFMVVSKVLIKNNVQAGYSPAEALNRVNARLLEGNDTGMFVTVWLAVIDLDTGKGVAANAGHEHPVRRKSGGDYELVKYKHSPAVSTFEGIDYKEHEFELEPGDSLFVYTDGVTEATNSAVELFGERRLVETLNANKETESGEMLSAVKDSIDEFVGEAPQFDDITMLYFRYNGNKQV